MCNPKLLIDELLEIAKIGESSRSGEPLPQDLENMKRVLVEFSGLALSTDASGRPIKEWEYDFFIQLCELLRNHKYRETVFTWFSETCESCMGNEQLEDRLSINIVEPILNLPLIRSDRNLIVLMNLFVELLENSKTAWAIVGAYVSRYPRTAERKLRQDVQYLDNLRTRKNQAPADVNWDAIHVELAKWA